MRHVNFSIVVIQLFCSVSTCPNRKDGLLLTQICNSPRESAREACKQFTQQQIESCAGFVFSNNLPPHFLWVLRCFGIFSAIFRHGIQDRDLANLWLFLKDRLVTQVTQVSRTSLALCVSLAPPIAYMQQSSWISSWSLQTVCAATDWKLCWFCYL